MLEVFNVLGSGFIERVYLKAVAIELAARGVPFVIEPAFPVIYKGQETGLFYKPDFLCFGEIILEIKAQKSLTGIDEAQLLNYLKVSQKKRGLLVNFGAKSLEWKRRVL